ncbi:hypothetical protein PIB30_100257 [Stylosanthes scabra]|uniref:Uncharacterized protein n=1 Tax=Stylosanthes scabra TaxID=79078 RepID=A0ABU6VVJ1_9FABA|nr:hypothetical protein [Stylosanthes scabra]
MPFELYGTLDLGQLKKSKEVFTMVVASIVSVARIAENVLVKVGGLTILADFHVIMPTKGDKGRRPQICEEGTRKISVMMEAREKEKECRKREEDKPKKGSRITPPPLKKKEKKESLKPAKKKKKHEEVKSRNKKKHKEDKDEERIAFKCSSLGNLLSKLKKIGKALRNNQKMDAHLVKDQSKWK